MPLDALDQRTLCGLPRLSEVYGRLRRSGNALSVNEIFALYRAHGFLIPIKPPLLPHLGQVRKMSPDVRGGDSLSLRSDRR